MPNILFMDGAHHGSSTLAAARWTGFDAKAYTTGTGRYGGYIYEWSDRGAAYKVLPASYTTLAAGVAYYKASQAIVNGRAVITFYGDGGSTTHVTIAVLSDGTLRAFRGNTSGTVLGTTTVAPFAFTGAWFYLEAEVVLDDAAGSVKIWHNGALILNVTGVDTRNGGTIAGMNQVYFDRQGTANTGAYVEDFYIADGRMGELRIQQLVPNGNGAYSQLVGSDGNSVDNYLLVDEVPMNSADYNGSATVGNKDTYALSNLAAPGAGAGPGTVHAVNLIQLLARSDAGAKSARRVFRSGGADDVGADLVVSPGYGYHHELLNLSPFTGLPWTRAEVDALEAGMEVRT